MNGTGRTKGYGARAVVGPAVLWLMVAVSGISAQEPQPPSEASQVDPRREAHDPVLLDTEESSAARDLHAKAKRKEELGDPWGAWDLYDTIISNYPDTHQATLARERMAAIEARWEADYEDHERGGMGIFGALASIFGSCCWLLFLGSLIGLWGYRAGWLWRFTFLERMNDRLVGMVSGFKDRKRLAQDLELRKANPLDAKSRHSLGVMYYRKRRFDQALQELAESVRIDPVRVDAQYHLALTQMRLGKIDEALPHLEYVVSKKPSHGGDAAVRLAEALLRTGDAQRAAGLCADFATKNPSDPDSRLHLAMAYDALGHPDDVPRLLEEAVTLGRAYRGVRRREAMSAARKAKAYARGRDGGQ